MQNYEDFSLSLLGTEYAKPLAAMEALIFDQAWDEKQYRYLLGQSHFLCWGILNKGQLCGYACGYLLAGELEIVNVAVDKLFRQQGLGTCLIRFVLHQSLALGMHRALLEVRQGNIAAQALYARCGFVPMGVRPGYYENTGEDALILEWLRKGSLCD